MKITGKLHVDFFLLPVEFDNGQALFWNPQGKKAGMAKKLKQLEKVSRTLKCDRQDYNVMNWTYEPKNAMSGGTLKRTYASQYSKGYTE